MNGLSLVLPKATRRRFERSDQVIRILDRVLSPGALASFGDPSTAPPRPTGRIAPGKEAVSASWAVVQRIRAARLALDWTQQDLAERSGIDRANIARLEAGRHSPTVATLESVAKALELSLSELFATEASAAGLGRLNARQARAGSAVLKADLRALREKGIVDAGGRRKSRDLPPEMREGTSDSV